MKIIAIIMILTSSILTAFILIRKEEMHCKSLKLTELFLINVKNKANIYSLPFKEIVKSVSNDNVFSQLDYIDNFLNSDNIEVPVAWNSAIKDSKLFFTLTEKQLLIEFCSGLIGCNREQISKHCDKYIFQINNIISTMDKDRERHSKLTTVISVSVGITVILFLI